MNNTLKIAAALVVLAAIGGAGFAGYKAGSYVTAEKMQKTAIAYRCGDLDRKTLAFEWQLPPGVAQAEEAAEHANGSNKPPMVRTR